jgi:F-type H+-transporting ATPase subunit delta
MIEGSLSRRYAKALFQLAAAEGKEEEVGAEIERFANVFENAALSGVLSNPAFALQSRKNIVLELSRRLELSAPVVHFLSLLLERDRLSFFAAIAERYRRLLGEKKGEVEARVIAASPLETNDLDRLGEALEKLSGKRVVLHQESDSALISGLVVYLEGKIYDGSVRTQLEKMQERMERGY